MRGISFAEMDCSIARTLDIIGERWTPLILRDAFRGARRFDEFLQHLPIARNILTDRLNTLVAHGIMERVPYQGRPPRYEYRLTRKGRDLSTALTALMQWGDRHLAGEEGPPARLLHRTCGHEATLICPACDQRLTARETRLVDRTADTTRSGGVLPPDLTPAEPVSL